MSAVSGHVPARRFTGRAGLGVLTQVPDEDRDYVRQAFADAIIYGAAAAAAPCLDCAVHPALLCGAHSAEMDWVSAYRGLLAAMS